MQGSGTKLVVALGCLAVAAGVTSWWYRYASSHRPTEFWEAEAAQLIARSDHAEAYELLTRSVDPAAVSLAVDSSPTLDLSRARGMAHLRHALLTDRNYQWGESVDVAAVEWRWWLRFANGRGEDDEETGLLVSDDFSALAKWDGASQRWVAVSCGPLASSFQRFFGDLGLVDASNAR